MYYFEYGPLWGNIFKFRLQGLRVQPGTNLQLVVEAGHRLKEIYRNIIFLSNPVQPQSLNRFLLFLCKSAHCNFSVHLEFQF